MAEAGTARTNQPEAGNWLLISTSAGADVVANALTDALKVERAQTTTMVWPQEADHSSNADELAGHLRGGIHRHGRAQRAEERQP